MTTPPGTVPLMDWQYVSGVHVKDDHVLTTCHNLKCAHIGFRVVDEAAFEAWMTGLTKPI